MNHQRGFSLCELLVCLGLMSMVVVAGWTLWDDAVHLMAAAGRVQHNPSFTPVSSQLRTDIHAAAGVADPSSGWSHGRLGLLQSDGNLVVYQQRGSRLWRVVENPGGETVARRRLVERVLDWRWREIRPGLIDVRLDLSLYPGPEKVLGRRNSTPSPAPVRTTRSLRLGLRNSNGGGQW